MNEPWLFEGNKGDHIYTVYRRNDPVPDLPASYWDDKSKEDKKRFAIWMLGTVEGRNLISTALHYLLENEQLSYKRVKMCNVFRDTLFNCTVNQNDNVLTQVIEPYVIIVRRRR